MKAASPAGLLSCLTKKVPATEPGASGEYSVVIVVLGRVRSIRFRSVWVLVYLIPKNWPFQLPLKDLPSTTPTAAPSNKRRLYHHPLGSVLQFDAARHLLSAGDNVRYRSPWMLLLLLAVPSVGFWNSAVSSTLRREIARISTRNIGAVRITRVGGRHVFAVIHESADGV